MTAPTRTEIEQALTTLGYSSREQEREYVRAVELAEREALENAAADCGGRIESEGYKSALALADRHRRRRQLVLGDGRQEGGRP